MNKINRTFLVVLIMLFVISTVNFASAETLPPIRAGKILANENGVNTDIYIDSDFVLNISAKLQDGIKGQTIGAVCYRTINEGTPEEEKFTVFTDQLTASASSCTLEFAKFAFPSDYPNGKYTVAVSGDGITSQNSKKVDIYFYGAQAVKHALSDVVNADGTDIAAALIGKPFGDDITNADILKIDYDIFNSLDGTSKSKLYSMLDNGDAYFTAIDAMTLPDDSQDVMSIGSEFIGLYSGALSVARYYAATNGADVSKWLEIHQSDSDLRYDFNGNAASDDEYLKQSAVINATLESMKSADKADSGDRTDSMYKAFADKKAEFTIGETNWKLCVDLMLKKITDRYREEIILTAVANMPSGEFKKLIEDEYVSKIFGSDVTDSYKMISSTDKSEVCSKISGTTYESFSALCQGILDEIDDVTEPDDSGSSGGNGGNSPGGNRGSAISVSGTPVVNAPKGFSDLQGSEWAREAIEYLYNKGIVNGKSEGIFDPNADVTRSEFVKMIVVALGFGIQNQECEYTDVNSSMWQYPYIAAASNFGIVNGYADASFGINDPISRQDMAVIAQRALKAYGKSFADGTLSFADSSEISQYAQSAIANLVDAGIITGMPDGTYAPKNNVTRAQAAVIIYRALMM